MTERSNSFSSGRGNGSTAGVPFAYQQRLLERTSSRSSGSLSRSSSQTGKTLLSNPTGTAPTRRWNPGHRVGQSLDTVRGRWEERVKAEAVLDDLPSSPVGGSSRMSPDHLDEQPPVSRLADQGIRTRAASYLSRTPRSSDAAEFDRTTTSTTPSYSKRHTLPAPIIASPLSPNTTGVTIENLDSPPSSPYSTPTPQRIHLPVSTRYEPASPSYTIARINHYTAPLREEQVREPAREPTSVRLKRSNTLDSINANSTGSSTNSDGTTASSSTSLSSRTFHSDVPSTGLSRRPASVYGDYTAYSSREREKEKSSKTEWSTPRPSVSRASSLSSDKHSVFSTPSTTPLVTTPTSAPADTTASSVMTPKTYRSSYMNRKAHTYGETMIVGRRLGRHLPRIASGDGPEEPAEDKKPEEDPPPLEPQLTSTKDWRARRAERERRMQEYNGLMTPAKPILPDVPFPVAVAVPDGDSVVGIPGRVRLSRDRASSSATSSLPAAKYTRGLWADVQRNLLQAYEYLCHIGEAQQWIEGCLGEELGWGVVEMEENMRNGVVLAKLVRVFQGEQVVRRIYEASRLDFRHSDNINIFFSFVRHVGLPESFIFELTDLYEKKNFPKVIYCIHALSHLLARRGLAERIGNLIGHLQFSDDQLQKIQKGLKDSGVAMPNFGNVGRELAKEINEEPEEEVETEEQRVDRELMESQDSIIAVQALSRGFLARKAHQIQLGRIRLAERYVPKFQARARAALLRKRLAHERQQLVDLEAWVVALQAHSRGMMCREVWYEHLHRIDASVPFVIKVQAQARGVLQRRKFQKLKAAMQNASFSIVKLQSAARAQIAQRSHKEVAKSFSRPILVESIVALQAHARGLLFRRKLLQKRRLLQRTEPSVVALQAQAKGVLLRRRIRAQLAKLDDAADIVVRIQAAARTYLARKRLLALIRALRRATPSLVSFQTLVRANMAQRKHKEMKKALAEVKVMTSVGGFQALARAAIARNRHREQTKQLAFVEPDVVGIQATVRGVLARWEFWAWYDYLHSSHPQATILQALLRGVLQRRTFRAKMQYYHDNLDKVIQIQSLFRAKETREQYRQLTLGTNVTVGTIKNFVHLLDDSETDFQEEIKIERLRQDVVKRIRENQALESDVNDLDVRIALVVQNVKSFEELIKVRKKHGTDSAAIHAARASVLAAHGDPFAGPSTLDHAAKRKLELYQQLFYLLQTKGEYLTRLFICMQTNQDWEKNRKLIERVVLTLFGYGQNLREDYLLLKLFQTAIHEEVYAASSIEEVAKGHPTFINIAIHYLRPKQAAYIRETFQDILRDAISADEDLETDPVVIYRALIDIEEMRSGTASPRPKDLHFHAAMHDPDTRAEYIRHIQVLQWRTGSFVSAMTESTQRMPYSVRYMARETLAAVRARFPDATDQECAKCIARLVYYRYINPCILTPETFEIVSHTIDISTRKNLAQISKMMSQITSGAEFGDDSLSYIAMNNYVNIAIQQVTTWLIEVANVPDAETQYHAHEFLDATVQPKAIFISPNEVYSMHALLAQHLDVLSPSRGDPLRVILTELDGVPHLGNDELHDARDAAIELHLTNRFAHVRDPGADEKALWVQAKRAVLAILRVQPAKDLLGALMAPVTDDEEYAWQEILEQMEMEQMRHQRRMPSTTAADSAYRLEDIRSMTFKEVKAYSISFLLELEKRGKISRADSYQGILNAIANDVRSKNRRRVQRQHEKESMEEALSNLADRKKYLEEQINSFNSYVETAMNTMQRGKGKKRFVMPFTKQFFHMRELQKAGKSPQFGSYKYSAQHFYEKGILLSIDQHSPRQFDKLDIILSSSRVGVFTAEIYNNTLGITNRVAHEDIKMEDLLQAQFENQSSISLFNGLAKFNLNLLLWQINKKFYV